jgi:hypothetical protein
MLFLAGALLGVWGFGETVSSFEPFFLSSYLGRFTLDQLLGVPMGVAVLLFVLLALAMFRGAELLERRFGRGEPWSAIPLLPRSRAALAAAVALVAASAVLVARGQPTPEQRWARAPKELEQAVAERAIFVHPAEIVALRKDLTVQTAMLDLRDEHAFNLFHVGGARRVSSTDLLRRGELQRLLDQPATTVTFLTADGEGPALDAWRALKALGVPNLYVVEGGMNRWLELYPVPACVAVPAAPREPGGPAFRFAYATGDRTPAAWPELAASRTFRSPCAAAPDDRRSHAGATWPSHAFVKRVKLQTRSAVKGGCG